MYEFKCVFRDFQPKKIFKSILLRPKQIKNGNSKLTKTSPTENEQVPQYTTLFSVSIYILNSDNCYLGCINDIIYQEM